MPTLTYINDVYDSDMGKYISGCEYDGEAVLIVRNAAVGTSGPMLGYNVAIEELMRRNLPISDVANGTTITVGGVIFGTPGASAGDTITITGTTQDGTGVSATYTYTLGDTLGDLVDAITAAFEAQQAGGSTFGIDAEGSIDVTDVVTVSSLTAEDTQTALALTFNDAAPGETTFTLGTWSVQTAAANAVKAAKALTAAAQPSDGDTVTIGSHAAYRFKTTLASANDVLIDPDVSATGTLTFTGNPSDTQTVTLGAKTYTFLTVLIDSENNVLIGATASDSLDNLLAAIAAGAGAGTLYGTGTTANDDATAVAGASDTIVATAIAVGSAGNTVASTSTVTGGTWTAATLGGGVDGTKEDTMENFKLAITQTAGSGTLWHAGTAANSQVTATRAGAVVTATALTGGTAGNAIGLAETGAQLSWAGGAAFLTGGVNAVPQVLDGTEEFEVATVAAVAGDDLNDLDQVVGVALDPPVS